MNDSKFLIIKAIVLLILMTSTSPSEDKVESETKCESLSLEVPFTALGYELGMCKDETENVMKEYISHSGPISAHEFQVYKTVYESEGNILNSNSPKHISYIVTTKLSAKIPHEIQLDTPPLIVLRFYNNNLFYIQSSFSYSKKPEELNTIYKTYEEYLNNKYGNQNYPKALFKNDAGTTNKSWNSHGVQIVLTLRDNVINVNYSLTSISEKAENEILEHQKKIEEEKRSIDRSIEGF
jgi:hypothetical protein